MGDKGLAGETLYQRFETLLEELGIRLEFDTDEEAQQDVPTDTHRGEHEGERTSEVLPVQEKSPRRRQRRASFNSTFDAGDETTHRSKRRDTSRSSLSRLDSRGASTPEARPTTWAATRAPERTQPQGQQAGSAAPQLRRGRLTTQEFADNLKHYQRRRRSTSTQSSVQIWRRAASGDNHGNHRRPRALEPVNNVSRPAEDSLDSLEETISSIPQTDTHADDAAPQAVFYRPSESQMLETADTFEHCRIQNIFRKALRRWSTVARAAHANHQRMEAIAVRIDVEALLRQAFDHWRVKIQERKRIAETNRFYAHLEKRATKARDLYLLTKAFTHYAQCASEEVLRTSVARRHILRTKYFNAWREITAVNELKVRRQGLKKFFVVWRRRCGASVGTSTKAITVYQENLVESLYWRWFWRFCERRAPQWRAGRMKKKYLADWMAAVRKCRERGGWVEDHRRESVQRTTVQRWLERTRIILSCDREAGILRERRLVGRLLPEWQQRLRLAPVARHVSILVDWRIARSAFSACLVRHNAEGQAAQVDRSRVLRNAWTDWNDHLRWQTLAHRIDDRVVLQALYKWVLAERAILFSRLLTQKSQTRVLSKFVRCWTTLKPKLDDLEGIVQESRNRRLLRLVCGHWRQQLAVLREKEQLAFEFHAPKVAQDVLRVWSARTEHVQQLQRWAKDANFYLLAKESIKRWQNATTESKRRKRRDAYAQVRRRIKMNLARRIILPWRERANVLTDMQRQAHAIQQDRSSVVGTGIFDHWRTRLDSISDLKDHADLHYKDTSLRKALQLWRALSQQQNVQQEQAQTYYIQMHASTVAVTMLRKLTLRMLQMRRQQETARLLQERNDKRHFRNIFRHWQDIVSRRRFPRPQEPWQSARARRTFRVEDGNSGPIDGGGVQGFGSVSRPGFDPDDWDPPAESRQNTTPLPGYLSTPSKRAARAKDKVRMVMTPKTPATPRGMSFERRLRSQAGTDPHPLVRRNQPGRSGALRPGHFEDIREASASPFGGNGNG